MKRTITALFICLGLLVGSAATRASWQERFKFSGDFRYRHEQIKKEDSETRDRQRIRARIAVKAKVVDGLTFNCRLASGSSDPVSTNQTLDGGFSTKGIWLDRAYFHYNPTDTCFHLMGGKVKNPLHNAGGAGLLWDGDLNPEGLVIQAKPEFGAVSLFVTGTYFWVEERSSDDDSFLMGAQAGVNIDMGAAKLTVGAGYYGYSECEGNATFVDAGDSFGNSVDTNDAYIMDYNELEAFMELGVKAGPLPLKYQSMRLGDHW